ncbi:MAG TPA: glutamate synthase-related protein [Anaerolineae bacterium]|nr:glutamate synthase-related protein [Anaerolineae bacterium]
MSANNHTPPTPNSNAYVRYHIETDPAPDIIPWPSRFNVTVNKIGLAKLLLTELRHYKGDLDTVLSRPCLYGVFSGPVGGFMPRDQYCVGCLRCTTEHPDFVTVTPNPERATLGDNYFNTTHVNAITYEAEHGRIPVRGAGYRGRFAGHGWDSMWTDMSEIVRPTRDGIHGREFISTVVDIGAKPPFLFFNPDGSLDQTHTPDTFTIPLPIIFDMPPPNPNVPLLPTIYSRTATNVQTLAILPLGTILDNHLHGPHLVPHLTPDNSHQLGLLHDTPKLVELNSWDPNLYATVQQQLPHTHIALRLPFSDLKTIATAYGAGIRIFHLTANYHGQAADGTFVLDLIRQAHNHFVNNGTRDEVTLLGSGGIIAAEHVPKAIIAGLDAVIINTPLLVALQTRFKGQYKSPTDPCTIPHNLNIPWGVQRLQNVMATWRDQLLEIMGAMGLREVRRLRGEMGRAMFHKDLEREAFAGIEGYNE